MQEVAEGATFTGALYGRGDTSVRGASASPALFNLRLSTNKRRGMGACPHVWPQSASVPAEKGSRPCCRQPCASCCWWHMIGLSVPTRITGFVRVAQWLNSKSPSPC